MERSDWSKRGSALQAARMVCVSVPDTGGKPKPKPGFAIADLCVDSLQKVDGTLWEALGFAS